MNCGPNDLVLVVLDWAVLLCLLGALGCGVMLVLTEAGFFRGKAKGGL
jgi:hypothetical protein